MISIIVPIFNEESILKSESAFYQEIAQQAELIFVDGGSLDSSVEVAQKYGKLLHSEKGRARQMNAGARSANGGMLLFLHADTAISADTLKSIESKTKDNGFIGGCLTQRIAKDGLIYRLIEDFGNTRAKLTKVFYGDQGIFVKQDVFLKLGGFPEVPVMEDVLFSKKLRRLGKTIVLLDKISVSPRRWEKAGVIKTIIFYSLLNILFWLKVPLNRIKILYEDLR